MYEVPKGKTHQLNASWDDENGHNTLILVQITGTNPLRAITLHGEVEVPDNADIYRPNRPEAVLVGKATDITWEA